MSRLVFDIEANGLNTITKDKNDVWHPAQTRVWCLSIVDFDTGEEWLFSEDDIKTGVEMLSRADVIMGHNIIQYDIPVLESHYGSLLKNSPGINIIDSVILSQMMYGDNPPGGRHSLKSWGEYLGHKKDEKPVSWQYYSHLMGEYCLQDSRVQRSLIKFLMAKGYYTQYHDAIVFEHKASHIISKMTRRGWGFDFVAASQMIEKLKGEIEIIDSKITEVFPTKVVERFSPKTGKRLKDKVVEFNPGSRQMLCSFLKEKYNWEPTKFTDAGNAIMDDEVLSTLPFEEVVLIRDRTAKKKLMDAVEDWLYRAQNSDDGKIHGNINPLGTITGRSSSSQPNIQNIDKSKEVRGLFKPSGGMKLVGGDLQALELRVLAGFLGDYGNTEYANLVVNSDVHTHNMHVMKVKDRDTAKVGIYVIVYGGGDATFSEKSGLSMREAAKASKNLKDGIAGLTTLEEACRFWHDSKGCVEPYGVRPIFTRKRYSALNTYIQAAGSMIVKMWMIITDKMLSEKYPGGDLWSWVSLIHDELQIEADPEIAEDVRKIMEESAEKAGMVLGCKCPIAASAKVGTSWADTH